MANTAHIRLRNTHRLLRKGFLLLTQPLIHFTKLNVFSLSVRHIYGSGYVNTSENDLIVVCLVRDGLEYISGFLEHYRSLGARHIVFLDNGSIDGTVEALADQSDVTVLQTRASYKKFRMEMKEYLVHRFGKGNWVLCVDIDEFFEYPFRKTLSVSNLLTYLNKSKYSAVVSYMIDLFPRGPVSVNDKSWRVTHRFYDTASIVKVPYDQFYNKIDFGKNRNLSSSSSINVLNGGVRSSVFGQMALLTKHPLVYPSRGARFYHHHHVSGAAIADFSTVLLHYKYVGQFIEYFRKIASEKSFYGGSINYTRYLSILEKDKNLSLYGDSSRELTDVDQLIDDQILLVSPKYLEFYKRESREQ